MWRLCSREIKEAVCLDALYIVVLVLLLPPLLLSYPGELKGREEGSLRAVLVYRIGLRLTGGCMLCGGLGLSYGDEMRCGLMKRAKK